MLAERITALITVIQSLPFFSSSTPLSLPPSLLWHYRFFLSIQKRLSQDKRVCGCWRCPAICDLKTLPQRVRIVQSCEEMHLQSVFKLSKLLSRFHVIWRRSVSCPLMGASARDMCSPCRGWRRAGETNTCYCIQLHNGDHLV